MSKRNACKFTAGLALAALLLAGPGALRGDQDQKTPPSKDGPKQPKPLQALKEAFSKG
jgi:hypothetical protein